MPNHFSAARASRSSRRLPKALHVATVVCALSVAGAVFLAGCRGGPESVDNPAEVLSRTGQSRERYFDALEAARLRGVDAPTKAALRRMVAADGYAIDARVMAFDLLLDTDRAALVEALGNSLPRMGDVAWRERACELIGARKIEELVPALIRSWANPAPGMDATKPRPERVALAAIVGEDQIGATLIRTMRESSPTTQANLRARCWELLMKLGDAPKLRALLADPDATRGDGMLIDLARVSSELGVLPVTREEILWARELCEPKRAEFFAEARDALAKLPKDRRETLEIRAIPVVVACAKRRSDLLDATDAVIFEEISRRIAGRRKASPDFTGYGNGFTESLAQQRDVLVWSDLAAMALALDMLAEPALLRHLFEQADRDREDRTTEYGGVLGMDAAGRAELLEFLPRSKASDVRFESPQALFDALYTRQFHYHNHTQKYDNADYAGPHMGDFTFADSTRCNGLVFTFLSADLLGVDFYRYGKVVVDLGAVERPQG